MGEGGGPPLGKNSHIFPFFWGGSFPNDIDYDICYDNDDICDDNNDIFDENDDICDENYDICDDKHASKLQISKQKVIGSQCSELPHKIKLHLHKNYKR